MNRCCFPYAAPGQKVGLLGGSFDPAHVGHVSITLAALQRFEFDQVWWLVSPGNPLKVEGPAPMELRMDIARAMMSHPRVQITDLEARIGTRYTATTLQHLVHMYPRVSFTWLMGADNLTHFHRWQDWQWIMDHVRVGVIARPGDRVAARTSKAARIYRPYRVKPRALTGMAAPAWSFTNIPMRTESSTAIRATGVWG